MAFEEIRQRSDLIGTEVVTKDTGKKLGVVNQLWVDIDQQQVVALSLRPSLFYGNPKPMLLSSIRQIGDVILVDSEDVIEDMDVEVYNPLINCEVITETGELLGKVRGYKFDVDSGEVVSLVIASIGLPLLPDQVVSTYELDVEEIVSTGPDRLIVFEGAEERLVQLSVGVMERLGIGRAPWERDDEEDYITPIRTDNQLGTGLRTPVATPTREREPMLRETWDEDNWNEPEPRALRQEMPPPEPAYYDDEEDSNWSDAVEDDYAGYDEPAPVYDAEPYYEEDVLEKDAWAAEETPVEPMPTVEPEPYDPPKVNIPEKKKAPEYEEESF